MMLSEQVTYEPRAGYPLYITAKRYYCLEFDAADPDALTLIFLHSTSFHKETWEPTISKIFHLVVGHRRARKNELGGGATGALTIREAWALDCPNHGASAQLNEELLVRPPFLHDFTCEKYAKSVHHFLSAGVKHGAKVDFRKRNLVGVGHSLGSVAMSILQHITPLVHFQSVILVEPLLSPAGQEDLIPLRKALVRSAYERRDVWPSLEEAHQSFSKRDRTKKWHPEIVKLFVKYALRPHPGSYFKDVPYDGLSLACTRDQEAAMYRDVDGPTKPVAGLKLSCNKMPVHIIFGAINDFMERKVHDAVIDPSSGRNFASVTRISGSGHLVPQEQPEKLGEVVFKCLLSNLDPGRKLSEQLARTKL